VWVLRRSSRRKPLKSLTRPKLVKSAQSHLQLMRQSKGKKQTNLKTRLWICELHDIVLIKYLFILLNLTNKQRFIWYLPSYEQNIGLDIFIMVKTLMNINSIIKQMNEKLQYYIHEFSRRDVHHLPEVSSLVHSH